MKYTCPMHPEIIKDRPGKCPKCGGMELVPVGDNFNKSFLKTYRPLLIIFSLLLTIVVVAMLKDWRLGVFDLSHSMAYFMAGFFLTFSGFKMLDLNGVAAGYASYDLLAKKWHIYGFIYPFIEFLFGLGYLLHFESQIFNIAVFVTMSFSGIGVLQKLMKKEKFQCACLGTVIKVPLTKITLIEDLGMALMALLMLIV